MSYERMLDKQHKPDTGEISAHIGPEAEQLLAGLEPRLAAGCDLGRELRFPFGNKYGWGYKYSHKKKHLCYLFFEKGALTAMLQLGDGAAVAKILPELSAYAKELWERRYPCGDRGGGWIHYRITQAGQLDEIVKLVGIKSLMRQKKQ